MAQSLPKLGKETASWGKKKGGLINKIRNERRYFIVGTTEILRIIKDQYE